MIRSDLSQRSFSDQQQDVACGARHGHFGAGDGGEMPVAGATSSLILTNGILFAPPVQGSESGSAESHLLFDGLGGRRDERLWVDRDWLRAELRERFPDASWRSLSEGGFWRWASQLREAVGEAGGIENSDFNPYREHNFAACLSHKNQAATLITYQDGEQRVATLHCGERLCPECSDRHADRVAQEIFEFVQSVATAQKIGRFWRIVITLPRFVEARIPRGSEERKRLMEGLKRWLRKTFRLKTRDGLTAYANVHAVGDSDLFRTRYHIHLGVLPVAVRRAQRSGGTPEVIHCDRDFSKADLAEMRVSLHALFEEVFPGQTTPDEMNLRLAYTRLDEDSRGRPAQWGRLRHGMRYDLRGFGKDLLKVPIFHDSVGRAVVVPSGDSYRVCSIAEVAERWRFIRGERDLRTWGVLDQRARYAELFGVQIESDPEPEILQEEPAQVERRRGRAWVPERRRVEWLWDRRAYRVCPDGRREPIPPEVRFGRRVGGDQWVVVAARKAGQGAAGLKIGGYPDDSGPPESSGGSRFSARTAERTP